MKGRPAILLVAGIVLAIFAQTPQAKSQTLGTLGTVGNIGQAQSCAPNRGFDPANPTLGTPGMTCYPATLTGCPGNADLQFVYGVEVLSGMTPNGTIVFLAGDGGVAATDGPEENTVVESYVNAGYQVVQIAWGPQYPGEDWEETKIAGAPSILVGACRPATFLNWVRNGNTGVGNGIWGGHGGMCAQGHSGGSGAIAYALTWYNAGAAVATNGQGYLDKVTLDAGPVFSDIRQGCQIHSDGQNDQYTLLCANAGQTGCKGWIHGQDPPGESLEYATGYKTEVNQWSGNNTLQACANNYQQTTYDTQWYNMSILAPAQGGQTPSFSFPNTTMTSYLCETGAPGITLDNVTAQGQLYYAQFTNQSQAGNALSVYAVTNCPSTEGIYGAGTEVVYNNNDLASLDMVSDMKNFCKPNHSTQ